MTIFAGVEHSATRAGFGWAPRLIKLLVWIGDRACIMGFDTRSDCMDTAILGHTIIALRYEPWRMNGYTE